jgi:hypothetical protein
MTETRRLLLWSPRVLGLAVGLFLALFALDGFTPATPAAEVATNLAIHLVPSAAVLTLVALSWHRSWIGAAGFFVLAALYAVTVRFRLDWTLAIAGPLLLVAVLFFWSWLRQRRS